MNYEKKAVIWKDNFMLTLVNYLPIFDLTFYKNKQTEKKNTKLSI